MTNTSDGKVNSIFVKNQNMKPFNGSCWPGWSHWIEFLNEAGAEYWGHLYSYESFVGTNNVFYIWNDMNEPSVFAGGFEGTFPKTNKHVLSNGDIVLDRDVHNTYGLMNSRATFNGLLKRDEGNIRPFVISRSAHYGT